MKGGFLRMLAGAVALGLVASWFIPEALGADHAYSIALDSRNGPVRLHVEEWGEGPPLILLHGLGASVFTWRHVAPSLARNHRVIAIDLKGFGKSEKPADGAYSAEDQAALVVAFIEKRDLHGVSLVGHSFGGTVALFVALAFENEPGRIAKLVVIDSPALPQDFSGAEIVEAPLLPDGLLGVVPSVVLARTMLTLTRRAGNPPSEEDIAGYAEPFDERAARAAFLEAARSIVRTNAAGYAAKFRKIDETTLVVHCRSDEIVPLTTGRKLARLMPHARLAALRGCNHLPQDERPDALLGIVEPFLAE